MICLISFFLFITRVENACGQPFPVDTLIFSLTCGLIRIQLSDCSLTCRQPVLVGLESSPHTTAMETKRISFPLTLSGVFSSADKRNVMSPKRTGLQDPISKDF